MNSLSEKDLGTDVWDESAEIYAEVSKKISFYVVTSQKIAQLVHPHDNMTIVDLGCGSSGLLANELIKAVPKLANLYCVDSSLRMLEVATQNSHGMEINFIHSDLALLHKYLKQPVDCVIINSAFFWVDLPSESFNQLRKIIAPGGQLLLSIAEWHLEFGEDVSKNPKYRFIQNELTKRNLDLWQTRRSMSKLTREALHEYLNRAGFTVSKEEEAPIRVELDDWVYFYQIPAIAQRSLPFVNTTTAMDIWHDALEELKLEQLRGVTMVWNPLRWLFISANRTS